MKNILNNIKKLTDSIEYKTQIIGRNQRLSSCVNNSRIGIIIGFIVTLIIVGIPIIFYKGGL
jgi:tetrahydromethanopterin S-methyltransferase subunit F